MNLRLKINLNTLLPITIGVLIVVFTAITPIYVFYASSIEDLIDDMTDDQQVILQAIARQQAYATGNIIIPGVQMVLLAGKLFERYYAETMSIKPSFTGVGCSVNLVRLTYGLDLPADFDAERNASASTIGWYDSPYNTTRASLDTVSTANLEDAEIMHFVAVPISQALGNVTKNQLYYAFEADGLYAGVPASPSSAYLNFSMPNCTLIEGDVSYYEPRCRSWYVETKANPKKHDATVTNPYSFAGVSLLGITICKANWNDTQLKLMDCSDFSIDNVSVFFSIVEIGGTYNYLITRSGDVALHPDFNRSQPNAELITIQDLEFTDEITSEIEYYNEKVRPLLTDGQEHLVSYKKNGDKM
jgi:hypothetical protein